MSEVIRSLRELLASRIFPILMGAAVFFSCWGLQYSSGYGMIRISPDDPNWPAAIPSGTRAFRGWPFVNGYGVSNLPPRIASNRPALIYLPGLIANTLLMVVCAISTWTVFDYGHRHGFKLRFSISGLMTLSTLLAALAALFKNGRSINDFLYQWLGLIGGINPYSGLLFSFFLLGWLSFMLVISFLVVRLLSVPVDQLLNPKSSGTDS